MRVDPSLQCELEAIYSRYAEALDDGPLEDWPEFFTEECLYLIQPRDNFDLGLPMAIMRCESRDMLRDRVTAVRETMMFEQRYLRHQVTNLRVRSRETETLTASANFTVVEVLPDDLPRILMVGRYLDTLRREEETWRFVERRCVFDSLLVPNSIIYPV
jgi:3-phenylpropionate/cinnamic acid dioxygenase small subunit